MRQSRHPNCPKTVRVLLHQSPRDLGDYINPRDGELLPSSSCRPLSLLYPG